ncbi:prenyltransferase [Elizabethkingia anophelis]|nr:prenyltransferase [Elizabethkingia anophelis]MDV4026014.1 prenyltransferase [Elizabethkingia anophelis]
MSHKEKSPEFYQYYPKLFHGYFPHVNERTVTALSEAGYLYYQSILNVDAIIDNSENNRIFETLSLQEQAIKKLSSIYEENHEFWQFWNKRKLEYVTAVQLEKKLWENPAISNYNDVADKKAAFGKIAIDSLFVLDSPENRNIELYSILLESHYNFSIAFQLYDDVTDFKIDFVKKQFNKGVYELSKILKDREYDINVLNKLFYIEGIGTEILNESIFYLDEAKKHLIDHTTLWYRTIIDFQKTIVEYRDITNGYIQTLKTKKQLNKIEISEDLFFDYSHIEALEIKNAINFIKKDYLREYAELKHVMFLGEIEGFENQNNIHVSDTFQRALLNDCIYDVTNLLKIDSQNYLQKEVEYIIGRRNHDSIGGWSYFPTVKEIAADIDDLGQIMQFFIKTGKEDLIHDHCLNAIKIAIEDRANKEGGIETWIIPNYNLNELQKKQDYFNKSKWGKGPDVEVVANFAYALQLFSPVEYSEVIKNAVEYIISNQKDNGSWESRWYFGSFYGTYVCLRLISDVNTKNWHVKEIVADFLQKSQNPDGSYGKEGEYILSTVFAIFCMNIINFPSLKYIKRKAKEFLIINQLEDGGWVAERFIKPKMQEPYSSRTLTTAYALKALLI